jgi:transposase InsO family protein
MHADQLNQLVARHDVFTTTAMHIQHPMQVGNGAVELLMRRAGLEGLTGRPRFRRIANVATASDRVERSFGRSERDQLWVTDITEHPTREGKVYCAVVLDAWSRRVVGWSIDSTPSAALATNALGMAIDQRPPAGEMTVIHSDQGTQFTSWAFTRRAVDSGLSPSMGPRASTRPGAVQRGSSRATGISSSQIYKR